MNNLLRRSKTFLSHNASTILTVIGGAGVVATSVMAVKATPKALAIIEEAKKEKGEDLTKLEIMQVAAPVYIPTMITVAATIACIFGANVLSKRKQAALISAYALLDNSYKEYKNKVVELYGEDANKEVRTELAKDEAKKQDIKDENDGKNLFYDEYSNRYFRAANETVLRAEYEVNKMLVEDYYVTLNELYDLLGLPKTDYGEYVGWSAAQMFEMHLSSWIHFRHEKVVLDDGLECFIISVTEPIVDFEDY